MGSGGCEHRGFNPEDDPFFMCIFADIAKAYPSVPRPELMAVSEKSGIP